MVYRHAMNVNRDMRGMTVMIDGHKIEGVIGLNLDHTLDPTTGAETACAIIKIDLTNYDLGIET